MRLGEMLITEGLATAAGLEEALESQVVHGGRLGTNLVELGLLAEKDLAQMLGRIHGVPYAFGDMTPEPKALELVDPNLADQRDLIPMRVEATRLSVAVVDPHDYSTLDAIAFQTGKRVVPVVIPEFRMNQLLRRHCKAFRPLRAIDMNVLRPSKTLLAADQPKEAPKDLISEEEFQSLYAQALIGGEDPKRSPAAPHPIEIFEPASSKAEPHDVRTEPSPKETPQEIRPIAPPLPHPPSVAARPMPPESTSLGPLSFKEAQKLLQDVTDREAIAKTVLQFALGTWRRALLLSVQGNLMTGWRGVGEGVKDSHVQRIGIVLRGNNAFKLVRDMRAHYVGPMKSDASVTVFYRMLGGGPPQTAVLLPLLVRGKVVHVLYVDDGPGKLTNPQVGELLILSQSVARSYEALIKRRKALEGL